MTWKWSWSWRSSCRWPMKCSDDKVKKTFASCSKISCGYWAWTADILTIILIIIMWPNLFLPKNRHQEQRQQMSKANKTGGSTFKTNT